MMAKGKKKAIRKVKNKGGRPTTLSVKLLKTIENLAMFGMSDAEICQSIEVPPSTFSRWKNSSERFRNKLFEAREGALTRVVRSMHERATGYKVKSVKIFADPKSGKTVQVQFFEHYPPDPGAAMSILKNRAPKFWRDKVQVEHQGKTLEQLVLASRLHAARLRTAKPPSDSAEKKTGEGEDSGEAEE